MGGDRRATATRDPAVAGSAEPATEAIDRLARQGYGRRFELRQGRLWCRSCERTFEAHDLVVEDRVLVTFDAGTSKGVLYALRCRGCGAAGTWLVGEADAEAAPLLERMAPTRAGAGQR